MASNADGAGAVRVERVPPRVAPAWARALDGLALVLAAAALFVSLAGRPLILRFGQVVLPSVGQLLFAAAGILAARHTAQPRPTVAATLAGWRAALAARPHAAAAVRAFVSTRPLVFFVAYFAVITIGLPAGTSGVVLSPDPLGNLPARFDAGWYASVARFGYLWDHQFQAQRNIAFFPAQPMLMRPVASLLGATTGAVPDHKRTLRIIWAGVLVSLAAFAWALWYLSRLGEILVGPAAASNAPLLLAAYPFAIFFNVPYSEGLFLLGSVAAFYHFHRHQWLRAGLWGVIVGLSRPNGAMVSVALAVLALQQVFGRADPPADDRRAPWPRPLAIRLLVAAMPGVGMLGFTAYLYWLTGVWFAWARMHGAWGREWSTDPLARGWEWLTTEGLLTVSRGVPFDTLNALAVLFALALLGVVFRRLGAAYGVLVLVNLVPPIFAGGALSMGRVTATLFPLFLALGASLRPAAIPVWVAAFGILQGFAAVLFFTWRELF